MIGAEEDVTAKPPEDRHENAALGLQPASESTDLLRVDRGVGQQKRRQW